MLREQIEALLLESGYERALGTMDNTLSMGNAFRPTADNDTVGNGLTIIFQKGVLTLSWAPMPHTYMVLKTDYDDIEIKESFSTRCLTGMRFSIPIVKRS